MIKILFCASIFVVLVAIDAQSGRGSYAGNGAIFHNRVSHDEFNKLQSGQESSLFNRFAPARPSYYNYNGYAPQYAQGHQQQYYYPYNYYQQNLAAYSPYPYGALYGQFK